MLTLYGTAGCHLCDQAEALLQQAGRARAIEWRYVDIADDADFVGRNLAKDQLAFGDVLLTAHGQYHWSCQERHRRLECLDVPSLPWATAGSPGTTPCSPAANNIATRRKFPCTRPLVCS